MKPVLKAPGTMLLKLRDDEPLSSLAFNFNLLLYILVPDAAFLSYSGADAMEVRAFTRPLLTST